MRIHLVLLDRPLLVRLAVEGGFDLVRQHDAVDLLEVAEVHRVGAERRRVAAHLVDPLLHFFRASSAGRRPIARRARPADAPGPPGPPGPPARTAVHHHHRLRILVLHHQRQRGVLVDEQAQRAAGLFLRFEDVGLAVRRFGDAGIDPLRTPRRRAARRSDAASARACDASRASSICSWRHGAARPAPPAGPASRSACRRPCRRGSASLPTTWCRSAPWSARSSDRRPCRPWPSLRGGASCRAARASR